MTKTKKEIYQGDVVDVKKITTLDRSDIFNKLWQPYIEQFSENDLIVAWGKNLKGKIDMGDIVCSKSPDQGENWENPVKIFDHSINKSFEKYAYANPALYVPPSQKVIYCFAMKCPIHFKDSENSQLCVALSSDMGRTWYELPVLNQFYSPLITCNAPLKIRDKYLLAVHRNTVRDDPYGDSRQFVLESKDLISWELSGFVPFDTSRPVFLHEGSLIQEEHETLCLVMRTATYGHKNYNSLENPVAYYSQSRDLGKTWSIGKPIEELHNTCSKAHYLVSISGYKIYVFSPGAKYERNALHYKFKIKENWSDELEFYNGKNKNSYPTLIENKFLKRQILCVWDSSDDSSSKRTVIRFGKFNY